MTFAHDSTGAAKTAEARESGFERLSPTSLIVCSRNRERLLIDTVVSILEGQFLPSEIIIVDQSDEPSALVAALGGRAGCVVRYVPSRECGVSRGRNLGAARAEHDLLVFTDDDMFAPAGWLGTLVGSLLRAGQGVVVTGQVLATAPEHPGAFAPTTRPDDAPRLYRGRVPADVLYSGNMAIHRSVLERAGGFDPRLGPGTPFPAAEDNDLCFRLLELGYTIAYEPEAILYHRAWRDRQDYLRHCWRYEVGQGAFYAKHLRASDRFMLKRMAGQISRQARRACRTRLRDRRKTAVDAISIGALLFGALQWTITHGTRTWRARPFATR